jgi:hypothetical protein
LEKFWRSLELLYYNILYIYIVYKNTIWFIIEQLCYHDMTWCLILYYDICYYIRYT